MEEIEKENIALPPPPSGSAKESDIKTAPKNSQGTMNERQEASIRKEAQYGSIPNNPNATEQKKTKAENDSSTHKSWWRSVFSFCIWTPEDAHLFDREKKMNNKGDSTDSSKLKSSPSHGEIKTRINRLSPQSSSAVNGNNTSPEDDYDMKDSSSVAGNYSH